MPVLSSCHHHSFKAKSWIDVFGNRSAKAFGSVVTGFAKDNPDALVKIGTIPSWFVSILLFVTSLYMGREFEKLIASGELIGENEGYYNDAEAPREEGPPVVEIEMRVEDSYLLSPNRDRRPIDNDT